MIPNKKKIYIIAEIGVNHNGNLNLAKKMILAAKKSGADAVKFQNFTANSLTTKNAKKAPYQLKNTKNSQSQYKMLKKLELKLPNYFILKKFAKKNKIDFFTSIFDKESIDFLKNKLKQKIIKIPSGEITNPLITENLNIKHYNLIVSTGMANLKEISQALNSIIKKKLFKEKNKKIKITNNNLLKKIKKKITLLHCVTDYPVGKNFANLNCIKTLSEEFKIPVGYSDHTKGIVAPIIAVSLGAKMIEKHFTLSNKMSGPDHKASLEPQEFSKMVKYIRDFEVMSGNGIKELQECERKNIKIARKSIIAKNFIKKGEKFSTLNLTTKRPGNGLSPLKIKNLIGKKSRFYFKPDDLIKR
tara:strand:- start:383 stop:1456 length:1074 start_codon:yes stop_codon:yes gene_type:complete